MITFTLDAAHLWLWAADAWTACFAVVVKFMADAPLVEGRE